MGSSFVLPSLREEHAREQVLSFNRIGREQLLLGSYEPGKLPVIYNVGRELRNDVDQVAVEVHEGTHQTLLVNTPFGLLTQLVRSAGSASTMACHMEQWSVQELDATFAELVIVAIGFPEEFERRRRGLPSASLDEPPYRELFDLMSEALPVEPGIPHPVLFARYLVVHALAVCSLYSDCLNDVARRRSWKDVALANYIRSVSPNKRFQKLLDELRPSGALDAIVDTVADELGSEYRERSAAELRESAVPQVDCFPRALDLIVKSVSTVPIHEPSRFAEGAQAAAKVLAKGRTQLKTMQSDPLPEFRDSPVYMDRLRAAMPERTTGAALAEFLSVARERGLGVWLKVSLRDLEDVWLMAHTYALAEPPHPGDLPPGVVLPEDLSQTIMPLTALSDVLESFPEFPHLIEFIKGSWTFWYAIPGAVERIAGSVRIVWDSELSWESLSHILSFDGLSAGAVSFRFGRKGSGRSIAVFASRSAPGSYGIVRVPAGRGIEVYEDLTQTHGVQLVAYEDVSWIPHLRLLKMIVQDQLA